MKIESQQASVSKFNKIGKYFIHSYSKIKMGGSIATEPFVWLDASTTLEDVVNVLVNALSLSKSNMPNPNSWDSALKDFLKSAGLNQPKDLYDGVISVGVLRKNGVISFDPLINKGKNGFVNVVNGTIEIAEDKGVKEIAIALGNALSKCK